MILTTVLGHKFWKRFILMLQRLPNLQNINVLKKYIKFPFIHLIYLKPQWATTERRKSHRLPSRVLAEWIQGNDKKATLIVCLEIVVESKKRCRETITNSVNESFSLWPPACVMWHSKRTDSCVIPHQDSSVQTEWVRKVELQRGCLHIMGEACLSLPTQFTTKFTRDSGWL